MIVLYHCLNLAGKFKKFHMVYLCEAWYYPAVILHNHCHYHHEKYFFFFKTEYLLFTPLGHPSQWNYLNYWCKKVQWTWIQKDSQAILKNFQEGQLSELSPADQRRTLGEIIEVRVDNAAHAVQFINYIIYILHYPYMSGNLTKNMAWRPQYKSRSLCSRLVIGWGN